MAKWESEFSQLMNAQRDELEDYGKITQNFYEGDIPYPTEDVIQYDDEGIPYLSPYVFGGSISGLSSSSFIENYQKRITNTWINLPLHALF